MILTNASTLEDSLMQASFDSRSFNSYNNAHNSFSAQTHTS